MSKKPCKLLDLELADELRTLAESDAMTIYAFDLINEAADRIEDLFYIVTEES